MNNIQTTIKKNNSKNVIIIKLGGSILNSNYELSHIFADILFLKQQNFLVVIVHGGGTGINYLSEVFGIKPNFSDGLRITDEQSLYVTQLSLIGETNVGLVQKLNLSSIPAVGLSGHDVQLMKAKSLNYQKYGLVGEIFAVNSRFLSLVMDESITPVIAPLAIDNNGSILNINADSAAASIAIALKAKHLILVSDVEGYYQNYPDKSSLITGLSSIQVRDLLEKPNTVNSGMRPKLEACYLAVTNQIESAHIIDGKSEFAVRKCISDSYLGTRVIL